MPCFDSLSAILPPNARYLPTVTMASGLGVWKVRTENDADGDV